MISRSLFIFLFVLSAALAGFSLFSYMTPSPVSPVPTTVFDVTTVLTEAQQAPDAYLFLESAIVTIMETYGTDAGFTLIDEAEARALIDNDGCHALLHYVGHAAYNYYGNDFEQITAPVTQSKCIGGYLHGVEAEILLASDDPITHIKDFCRHTEEQGITPGSCYHGVGHAAAELYDYDPHESLAACDALASGPEPDLTNCYRGIFSEIGNVVLGIDGHTGRERERVALFGLTDENVYEWCNTFDEQHRSSCKSQLTKLLFSGKPQSEWFLECRKDTFSVRDMNICTNITSGTFIRQALSHQKSAQLPATVNTLPIEAQKIAALGALESFNGFLYDGKHREYKPICESFTDTAVYEYCDVIFSEYLTTQRATWTERTDIR